MNTDRKYEMQQLKQEAHHVYQFFGDHSSQMYNLTDMGSNSDSIIKVHLVACDTI